MGSVCCVAVKDRKVPSPSGSGLACSPQWSFRRDNRRRVADEIESEPYYYSPFVVSRRLTMDKMSLGSERGALSAGRGGTPPLDEPLGTLASQKSIASEMGTDSMAPPSSVSSLARHDHTRLLPPKSTPSRRARRSPGHQPFRQVSDSQVLALKAPSNNNSAASEVLSTCSNDLATGSHNASSEGVWSLNTFSELVAYSQRERWSFDSEHLGSSRRKFCGGSSRFSFSPSVVDQQTCGACSKLLTERSSVASFELPIAAVLACGHVYHAECLENMTTEVEKYDPACPICTIGEKRVAKITKKVLKAEAEAKAKHYKRCKNRVVDSYGESDQCDEFMFQRKGKALKMEPSYSSKAPSKSFLKFRSISSTWSKPSSKEVKIRQA